ncbi:MAG TPA: HAMP domain-containing sensor histidine kinase [Gaiellaceae bacterium]|nr:HAMP domain-containing sensor histidine kinase [Gaiellaceae bacterium]
MSIRFRVVLSTVVLSALAVGAADIATSTALRRYVDRRDQTQVREVAQGVRAVVASGRTLRLPSFPGTKQPVLVEVFDHRGRLVERVAGQGGAKVHLPADLRLHPNQPRQVGGRSRGSAEYEAIALATARGQTVVAVISIRDDVQTLTHLAVVELAAGLGVLLVLAFAAAAVLTVSLRPLRRIAETADAIADGDLGARVPPAPKRSEVGRVASALNRMLSEIEAAFQQRDETEVRLRRFLADASHELRTPLTSIRGYAELFRRGAQDRPQDLARAMSAIEHEAEQMAMLVEDLLLLARLDETRPIEQEQVALDDIVEAAVESMRVVDPYRTVSVELSERPLLITGDAPRLRQVVDNLLANVRAHTPAGASAAVELEIREGRAILTVEDTGPGVPEAEQERIFDRFTRIDPARARASGGAGLGLAVVRSIVAAHGGNVGYRGARRNGSIFTVTLPVAETCPSVPSQASFSGPPARPHVS